MHRLGRAVKTPGGLPSPSPHLATLLAEKRRTLSAQFELLDETYTIAGRAYAFTRVADPEQVLDQVIAAEGRGEVGRMPYWAELWESAIGIGEWLHQHPATAAGKRVLDLGCGMGFAGMIAASLGATVTFVDIEAQSLEFALLNALAWSERVSARPVDWQTDRMDDRYDLILGADVLYDRAQWEYLNDFWLHHLAPDGAVLLGEPTRPNGAPFPDWIRLCGWKLELSEVRLEDRSKTIRLLTLRR